MRNLSNEIQKLKAERDKTLAQIQDAEARKHIQEQLDGISVDNELKALDNVREYAQRIRGEVQVHDELHEDSTESKLSIIKEKTSDARARARLEQLKAQRASKNTTT